MKKSKKKEDKKKHGHSKSSKAKSTVKTVISSNDKTAATGSGIQGQSKAKKSTSTTPTFATAQSQPKPVKVKKDKKKKEEKKASLGDVSSSWRLRIKSLRPSSGPKGKNQPSYSPTSKNRFMAWGKQTTKSAEVSSTSLHPKMMTSIYTSVNRSD